jgi:acetyltransferase
VRPQDASALTELVARTAPEDRRLRFHGAMQALPQSLAVRLSQIDYDREMALVAEAEDGAILGVARLNADPDGLRAEFALLVRTDWHDKGLGRRLLARLLDYADARGIEVIWGSVLAGNLGMLELTDAFGFGRKRGLDPDSVTIERTRKVAQGAVVA